MMIATRTPTCIVANCLYKPNQSYAIVPDEWIVRVLWLRVLEREDLLEYPGQLFVCLKHFKPEMFYPGGQCLLPNAIPYLEVIKFPPTQCVPLHIFNGPPSLNPFNYPVAKPQDNSLHITNITNSCPTQMTNVPESCPTEKEEPPGKLFANVASQTTKMLLRNPETEKKMIREKMRLRFKLKTILTARKKILKTYYTRQLFKQRAAKILSPELAETVLRTARMRKKNQVTYSSLDATNEQPSAAELTHLDNNLEDVIIEEVELTQDEFQETKHKKELPKIINVTVIKDPISDELNLIINQMLSSE